MAQIRDGMSLNRKVRKQRRKSFISCFMIVWLLGLTAGCAGRTVNSSMHSTHESENELTFIEAPAFYPEQISLPDPGVRIIRAYETGDRILLCGEDDNQQLYLYRFIPINLFTYKIPCDLGKLHAESVDGLRTGEGLIYSLAEDGSPSLIIVTEEDEVSLCPLSIPEELAQEYIMDIRMCGEDYYLQTPAEIIVVDSNGSVVRTLGPFASIPQLVRGGDDSLKLVLKEENGITIQEIFPENGLSDETFMLNQDYNTFFDGGSEGVLLAQAGDIVFEVELSTGRRQGIVNRLSSGDRAVLFFPYDAETYFSVWDGVLVRWKRSQSEDISILTLATCSPPDGDSNVDSLRELVREYNSTGAPYKVEILDYAIYNTSAAEDVGMDLLRTDIIAGKTPDIYDLWHFPTPNYSTKGLVQDLLPFFEEDKALSIEDLVPSAIEALERDGHLYDLVPSFNLTAMFGPAWITNTYGSMGFDDLYSLAEDYTPSQVVGMGRQAFLLRMLVYSGNQYINLPNGSCDFCQASFVNLLEFSKALSDDNQTYLSYSSIYSGRQLLLTQTFSDPVHMWRVANALFHGQAALIPFPESNSMVNMAPCVRLGMSADSDKKEGVWDFFRYLLRDDVIWRMDGIPIKQELLERYVDVSIKAGQEPKSLGMFDEIGGEFIMELPSASPALKSEILQWISLINGINEYDPKVYDIILQEAERYYAGLASADSTAESIQSRVSVYLAEQYS